MDLPINTEVNYRLYLHNIFRYWLPVALLLSLMFYLSSDRFSVSHTQSVVDKFLNWLLPVMQENTRSLINHGLRKLAHFLEYALLAALLFRAFRADSGIPWRASWAIYSGMVVIAWAVLDETRQTFSHIRHGSMSDALLDVAGGLLMLLLITLHHYRTCEIES